MTEPMYVIVQSRKIPRSRPLHDVHPFLYDNPGDAQEKADHLRDIAERGGRYSDRYGVYELVEVEREAS